ncbi:uncharacterized protein EI97DRAFT_455920 [Westerdykella ornata]|uniref:Uncharacterized protein n=1 Tax=Westerdykella ornata TaxID=318751 RepID=A0A6A6JSX2_WESOR|nr:uncharacterized protein EI97DRAFT_455920 [Westerdykella ornata]KAF2279711.1 hypothetical protein EI97DRAFT_455920 [Westerdykella ornata]
MSDAAPAAPDEIRSRKDGMDSDEVLAGQEHRRQSDGGIANGNRFRDENLCGPNRHEDGDCVNQEDYRAFDVGIHEQGNLDGVLSDQSDHGDGFREQSADRIGKDDWDIREQSQGHHRARENDFHERVNREHEPHGRNASDYARNGSEANGHRLLSRGDKRGPGVDADIPSPPPKKIKKKPGPKPMNRPPPVKKDDARAKKALIRQIEGHWGKDFIKNYIPKYHRPLQKRKKGKPRTHNRKSEDDPMKWMPSVLKAILSLAAKSDDKARLKKLMGDVVRYRIQHTGNKKPQLVTTDFDVIEDMLDHGWSVGQSFSIRYKHLMTNRDEPTDTKEKDAYYKDLFREESSSDGSEAYGDESGEDDEMGQDDDSHELTHDYQMRSGYYEQLPAKAHQRHSTSYAVQEYSKSTSSRKRGGAMPEYRVPPTPRAPGSSYAGQDTRMSDRGAKPDRSRPRPRDDYGLLDGPDTYDSNGYSMSRRYSYEDAVNDRRRPAKADVRTSDHSRIDHRNANARNRTIGSSPETPLARMRDSAKQEPKFSRIYKPSPAPKIKAEPLDDESKLSNRHRAAEASIKPSGPAEADLLREEEVEGDGDSEEELRAQLELAEAKANAAKLRLMLLSKKRRSGAGESKGNPLSLGD